MFAVEWAWWLATTGKVIGAVVAAVVAVFVFLAMLVWDYRPVLGTHDPDSLYVKGRKCCGCGQRTLQPDVPLDKDVMCPTCRERILNKVRRRLNQD